MDGSVPIPSFAAYNPASLSGYFHYVYTGFRCISLTVLTSPVFLVFIWTQPSVLPKDFAKSFTCLPGYWDLLKVTPARSYLVYIQYLSENSNSFLAATTWLGFLLLKYWWLPGRDFALSTPFPLLQCTAGGYFLMGLIFLINITSHLVNALDVLLSFLVSIFSPNCISYIS